MQTVPQVPTAGAQPPAAYRPLIYLLAWFAGLLGILYGPVLVTMVREWFLQEEMGHAVFIPFVAGYIVWRRRQELLALEPKPNWWALLVVAWGFIQLVLGVAGADFFIARTAFLISLVGVIWTLGGAPVVRALAFPLFLLLFMIRIPLFIYSQITFPLQIFASQLAAAALSFLGVPVMQEGNVLELASQRLSVVEACSGIRSLLSLSFLSIVYAYFFDRKVWMRAALLVASVPIAILANAGRVTLTGIISEYKPEFAEGAYHTAEGMVLFMIALAALIATHGVLNRLISFGHAKK